jgi:hypothetical protein
MEVVSPVLSATTLPWPADAELRASRERDGEVQIHVEIQCDCSKPRPSYWEPVKRGLKKLGFEMEGDAGYCEDEIFMPTTFFSAFTAIAATKRYPAHAEEAIAADVAMMTAFFGLSATTPDNNVIAG